MANTATNITLNRLREEMENLSLANEFVSSFHYGAFLDILKSQKVDYCSVMMNVNNASIDRDYLNITIEIAVADKVDKDNENRNDVESDTLQILSDIFSVVSYSNRWNDFSKLTGSTPARKFISRFEDDVTGWGQTINLSLKRKNGICDLPIVDYDYDGDYSPLCAGVRIFQDGILIETVPSGGSYSYTSGGGDPASNQVNGDAKTDIPAGGSKNFIIQDPDGNPVSVTEISDSASQFVGEVVPAINNVYYNRPYLTQITSYNIYDEAWRRLNGGNDYNLSIPENAPIQSVAYDFTNGRYDYLKYFNSFGHKFRFTGENGGYYDEADGNYYDVNGNLSSLAVEFPIISFGASWIYDHLTGYRFPSRRLGARTWAVAMNEVATFVFGDETEAFNPSADEWAQLSTFGYEGLNIFIGNAIRPFFNFDQSQHWSGTTRQDQTTTAWFKRADEGGRMRSGTKTSSGANRSHFSVFDNGFVTQP
jgi:hypothetical protein